MTVKLYPQSVYEAPPTHFRDDVVAACEVIHKAFAGFGSDKDALIRELADKSLTKRAEIYHCYKSTYDKDLFEVMKSEVGGDLGDALCFLAVPIHYAEAHMLHRAMGGLGSRDRLIYPILCGRSNREIIKLKETFFELFNQDLGVRLASELSGDFERLIFWALQGDEEEYDPKIHTAEKAEADAEAFHKAGEGWFGTDEKSLFKIIAKSPARHLERVNDIYVEKYERTLIAALTKETSGVVEKATTFTVGMKLKPYPTIAANIQDECGLFTDELALTCTIIRYQHVLKDVNKDFEKEQEKNLEETVKHAARGKYERLLVNLVEKGLSM